MIRKEGESWEDYEKRCERREERYKKFTKDMDRDLFIAIFLCLILVIVTFSVFDLFVGFLVAGTFSFMTFSGLLGCVLAYFMLKFWLDGRVRQHKKKLDEGKS